MGTPIFGQGLIPLLQQCVPPGALNLLRRTGVYRYGFLGNYPSWEEAQRASGSGYLDQGLVEPLSASAAALAEAERDNPNVAPGSLGLLSAMLMARQDQERDTPPSILDFGGALGNHYQVLRRFLGEPKVNWLVCETPMLAKIGQERFATDELRFTANLAEAQGPFSAVVCSGTLQYIPEPLSVLRELLLRSKCVLLDRLPLANHPSHRLSMQHLPPWLHKGRYPSWIFSRNEFLRELASMATVQMQWAKTESIWYEGETLVFQGILLRSLLI